MQPPANFRDLKYDKAVEGSGTGSGCITSILNADGSSSFEGGSGNITVLFYEIAKERHVGDGSCIGTTCDVAKEGDTRQRRIKLQGCQPKGVTAAAFEKFLAIFRIARHPSMSHQYPQLSEIVEFLSIFTEASFNSYQGFKNFCALIGFAAPDENNFDPTSSFTKIGHVFRALHKIRTLVIDGVYRTSSASAVLKGIFSPRNTLYLGTQNSQEDKADRPNIPCTSLVHVPCTINVFHSQQPQGIRSFGDLVRDLRAYSDELNDKQQERINESWLDIVSGLADSLRNLTPGFKKLKDLSVTDREGSNDKTLQKCFDTLASDVAHKVDKNSSVLLDCDWNKVKEDNQPNLKVIGTVLMNYYAAPDNFLKPICGNASNIKDNIADATQRPWIRPACQVCQLLSYSLMGTEQVEGLKTLLTGAISPPIEQRQDVENKERQKREGRGIMTPVRNRDWILTNIVTGVQNIATLLIWPRMRALYKLTVQKKVKEPLSGDDIKKLKYAITCVLQQDIVKTLNKYGPDFVVRNAAVGDIFE